MSELHDAVDNYLTMRRKLGYVLVDAGRLLPDFVAYMEQHDARHVTTELAVAWATVPSGVNPIWWRQRLIAVRGFAQYLKHFDQSTEVPPADVLRASYSRVTPYLYSAADIAALMSAAQTLSPPLRAATYETLIGLLATTGVRIGEAIGLDRTDLDVAAMLLRVRRTKTGTQREVPLHETTISALRAYLQVRDDQFLKHESESLFVSIRGTRICQAAVNDTFPVLVDRAGLSGRGARCRPRIHDLRHSFAVRSLLDWYEQGVADIDVRLPLLSSVLGHVNPASTYWYLEAAPELMAIVSARLEGVLGELP